MLISINMIFSVLLFNQRALSLLSHFWIALVLVNLCSREGFSFENYKNFNNEVFNLLWVITFWWKEAGDCEDKIAFSYFTEKLPFEDNVKGISILFKLWRLYLFCISKHFINLFYYGTYLIYVIITCIFFFFSLWAYQG